MHLTPVNKHHSETLFTWQQIPGIRKYFRQVAAPTWEEHSAWFSAVLEREAPFWLIMLGETPIGYVRLDPCRDSNFDECAEVSIMVVPKFQGQGAAQFALESVIKFELTRALIAEILPENKSSIKLFLKLGFKPVRGHCYQLVNKSSKGCNFDH